jgi:hypothetical protein
MNLENALKILDNIQNNQSKWELETIKWADRATNPETLKEFLKRIYILTSADRNRDEDREYQFLLEMLEELDETECRMLLSNSNEISRDTFIENLARQSALETLSLGKISLESLTKCCKLSPNDFILCAKRTQDLIDAIHGLVIKGENLSRDIAGA